MTTYHAYTWDHEADAWELRHRGVSNWGLRGVIRELRGEGWTSVSTLIEREEDPLERERRIVAANLDLIDGLMHQTGRHRHWLADEFRSQANYTLFHAARAFVRQSNPADARPYLAKSILRSFAKVQREFHRQRRTWQALDAAALPEDREVAPDVMAALREELGRIDPGACKRTNRPQLSVELRARLAASIAADPARSNMAIARAFFAEHRLAIAPATVGQQRKKMGLPPSTSRGGAHLHRRNRKGAMAS